MRVSDLRFRTLVAFIVPMWVAACASIAGDFTTHPVDAGASEDSSVEASGDGPLEAQAMDSSAPIDGPSGSDTGSGPDSAMVNDSSMPRDASDAASCAQTVCGTSCVDPATDPLNCGTCGNDCSQLPHVASSTGVTCVNGRCQIPPSSCAAGWAHCTGNAQNGCETSLSNSMTCGSCSNMCSGNTSLCGQSGDAGDTYGCESSCSGATPNLCGSTCTNTQADPLNCNTCSNACPTVTGGGNATCTAGVCGVSCNSGEHECGSTARCALDTDINNCGPNCTTCSAPANGSVSCTGGNCVPSCPGSDTICNNTCVDTTSNSSYCGNCTTACTGGKTCQSSVCACPSSAPTICSNTCVDTQTDSNNCGTCGRSCQGGACSNGACQSYILANVIGTPGRIATDGTSVAWTQTGLGSAHGGVYSVNNTGAMQTPKVIDSASGTTYSAPIAMAAGNIFYFAASSGSIYEGQGVAGTAGSGENLGTLGPNIVGLGLGTSPSGATVVYGAYNTSSSTVYILSCPVATLSCHLVTSQVDANGMAYLVTDGTNVYYTQPGGLKWAPLSGGSAPASFISGLGNPQQLAIPSAGAFIYFADNTSEYFWRSTIPTAAKTMLFDNSASGSSCYSLAADSKYYYYAWDFGTVYAPVGGGAGHGFAGSQVVSLAIDGVAMYWIDTATNPTSVNKIALPP